MNRMQGKDGGGNEGKAFVLEEPLGDSKQQRNNERVQHQIRQVKSIGNQPKHFVTNQEAENADRAIIIRGPTRAQMRQYSGAKDLTHVGKAADVRIGQNLVVVVVDKAVAQSIEIGSDCEKEQQS